MLRELTGMFWMQMVVSLENVSDGLRRENMSAVVSRGRRGGAVVLALILVVVIAIPARAAAAQDSYDHLTRSEFDQLRSRLSARDWTCYDYLGGKTPKKLCILKDHSIHDYFGEITFQFLANGEVGNIQVYFKLHRKYKKSNIEARTLRLIGNVFLSGKGDQLVDVAQSRDSTKSRISGVKTYWAQEFHSTFLVTPGYLNAGKPRAKHTKLPSVRTVERKLRALAFKCGHAKMGEPQCTRDRFGMRVKITRSSEKSWTVSFEVTTDRPVGIVEATRTAAEILWYGGLANNDARDRIEHASGSKPSIVYASGYGYSIMRYSDWDDAVGRDIDISTF